jgi:signal transduction histidine kinase
MSFPDVSGTFRPSDKDLTTRERSQIQAARLLFFLGAILCLVFIPLYDVARPEGTDPTWMRVLVSGLLAAVAAASYGWKWIRRTFSLWVRATVYLVTAWFAFLTALNGFRSDYEIGLLLLYSIFTVIVGLGARSIRPVLWYAGTSLVGTVVVVVGTDVSVAEEAVLLGAMATVAVVLSVANHWLISTRKSLQEQESRLRGLANSTPGVVFQFYARGDGRRGTYFVSEHANTILGLSPDRDTFYERCLERVPESHRGDVLDSIEVALEEKKPWRCEFPFEKPSGERVWLLGTSTPEVRDREIIFNGLLLDITDRKEAETQLREAKQEAEEASAIKTAMLANVSHEIRTPLTSILGFSELLKDRLSGRLERFARRTYESSRRLSETLNSILRLSKLEAGVATLDREAVSLPEVVREVRPLLEGEAEKKSITIETDRPGTAVTGHWNADALRRIPRNLLENAIKFTPSGGRIDVRIRTDGTAAVLEVEDTGIGIREEVVPEIFQAFRQESEGLSREYEGSGLGLSIVRHLVEEHRGTIEVRTEKGEGTCFVVRLPTSIQEAGPSETHDGPEAESDRRRHETISTRRLR